MSSVFSMRPDNIYRIVIDEARQLGMDIAPHDLRRTYARLCRRGGAPLEQIQQVLGHASVETTARYVGSTLELARGKAAPDYIDMEGEGE